MATEPGRALSDVGRGQPGPTCRPRGHARVAARSCGDAPVRSGRGRCLGGIPHRTGRQARHPTAHPPRRRPQLLHARSGRKPPAVSLSSPPRLACAFGGAPGRWAAVPAKKLAKRARLAQTMGMSVVRQMYALMAARRPVQLSDGRTGVITRVDTSFPENETTVHVWTKTPEGPGLSKVSAKTVTGVTPSAKPKKTA